MPKKPYSPPIQPECGKPSLGLAPSVLAKRETTYNDYTEWPVSLFMFSYGYTP